MYIYTYTVNVFLYLQNDLVYYEEHMSTYFYANTGKTE